jgi:hypothetical protein
LCSARSFLISASRTDAINGNSGDLRGALREYGLSSMACKISSDVLSSILAEGYFSVVLRIM